MHFFCEGNLCHLCYSKRSILVHSSKKLQVNLIKGYSQGKTRRKGFTFQGENQLLICSQDAKTLKGVCMYVTHSFTHSVIFENKIIWNG